MLTESVEAIVDMVVEQATLASWAIVHGLAMLALDGRLDEDAESNMSKVLQLFAVSLGQPESSTPHEAHPAQ